MKNSLLTLAFAILFCHAQAGSFQQNIYVVPDWQQGMLANQVDCFSNPYNRETQGTDAQFSYSYIHLPGIQLHCKRSCGRNRIKKPFVFIEGISFDFNSIIYDAPFLPAYLDGAALTSVREQNLIHAEEPVGYGSFNWATLCMGLDADGVRNGSALRIQKLPTLLNRLEELGYDIVLVDFQSGERYIQSNAAATIKAIEFIHDSLEYYYNQGIHSNIEPMVVCGASMGGLVARYAINKIEAQGHTNWVSHFVSFDSPQMGANIPLGMQCALKRMSNNLLDEVREKYEKLTCPSASQLVNYSCLEISGSPLVLTTPQASQERTELMNSPYMGWPQHCRKISISNGSRNGVPQTVSLEPGDKIFGLDSPINLDLWSLPANDDNYNSLFKLNLPLCVPAGLLAGQTVKVKNSMALDLAPGSYRDDISAIKDQIPWAFSLGLISTLGDCNPLNNFSQNTSQNKLCFIPTASSIGVHAYEQVMKLPRAAQTSYLQTFFSGQAKKEDPTHQFMAFDVAYAPAENQTHVEITDENIEWVISELADGPALRIFSNQDIAQGTYIARDLIQAGFHFSIEDPCPFNHLGPSNSGGGINPGQNTPASACGPCRVTNGQSVYFKSWNKIELKPGFSTQTGAHFVAEIIAPITCAGRPWVWAEEPTISSESEVQVMPSLGNEKETLLSETPLSSQKQTGLKVFPNPSKEVLFLQVPEGNTGAFYRICNPEGRVLQEGRMENNTLKSLDTGGLPIGLYFLQVQTAKEGLQTLRFVRH